MKFNQMTYQQIVDTIQEILTEYPIYSVSVGDIMEEFYEKCDCYTFSGMNRNEAHLFNKILKSTTQVLYSQKN